MTAFLFISSVRHAGLDRRVDLANFASLFGDHDEPPLAPPLRAPVMRVALLALLLVGAMGDVMMVSRVDVLSGLIAASPGVSGKLVRSVSF